MVLLLEDRDRIPAPRGGSHPAPERLEHFMRGTLPWAGTLGIVRHLLTGCSECVAVTRSFWKLGDMRLRRRGTL